MNADYDVPATDEEKAFFAHIKSFAFEDLNAVCMRNEGKSIEELITKGNYKAVVDNFAPMTKD